MEEKYRLLAVDDSRVIRAKIRKEFEQEGFEVFEAENGKDAIEKLASICPDVITMDVDMPELDGFSTCSMIRHGEGCKSAGKPELASVPIVFLTANDTDEGRATGFRSGATEFVTKPFLPGELLNTVNRVLKSYDDLTGYSALVVDDSVAVRMILKSGLESKGLDVVEAEDGSDAIEILKKGEQQVDIVITDYLMEQVNGDELCDVIRNELGRKTLPIVFLTGFSEKSFLLKMFKAGATDYLIKPFMIEELHSRITVHLQSKSLEDELRAKVVELKKVNQHKDRFLSICSHDIRSPLNGIIGFSDILMDSPELKGEAKEYLSEIKKSGEFLHSIITDILEVGRVESEEVEIREDPLDVLESLRSSVKTLSFMANPKKIDLVIENQFEGSAKKPTILGDQNAMFRILDNLLSNAIKFSERESSVVVELRPVGYDLEAVIRDEGIGIPESDLVGLFDPYVKTSRIGTAGEPSFGLGMKIVSNLVEQMDGTISVESVEGQGTEVKLRFPLLIRP